MIIKLKTCQRRIWNLLPIGLLVVFGTSPLLAQEKITREQSRQIQRIRSGIDRAERLFQNNRVDESARTIAGLAADLETLVDGANDAVLAAAAAQHQRLVQARQVLLDAGQTLPPIAALPAPRSPVRDQISFSTDVTRILMTHCGNCHVNRTRGKLSMASYSALVAGIGGSPVIVPMKPDESWLIEVIEQGKMPPQGTPVAEADLATLKQWIAEGASYDREDPSQSVSAMAAEAARQARAAGIPAIALPTGRETVSFSQELAPVLIENCIGCHFEARNVQGGLRMDTFRQFLRGGDNGNLMVAGDGQNSLLVQRLRATDNTRMPRGRPPLDETTIEKIVTWINEGGRFDGRDAGMNLREVAAIARSENASHEALSAERAAVAHQRWNKVMPDVPAVETATSDFLVLGTADGKSLERIGRFAQEQAAEIRTHLGIPAKQPLVKGQISLFVFERRYDYNEFGKMVEGRDLPADWKMHWGYDTVNAWVAMQVADGQLGQLQPQLQQALAALAVSGQGINVPRWFADGSGFMIAEKLVGNAKLVKQWQAAAVAASGSMKQPTDFLRNQMSDDRAALVAYGFVRSIMGNRRQFDQMMQAVRASDSFEQAFVQIYSATPLELVQPAGSNGTGNRRQRK